MSIPSDHVYVVGDHRDRSNDSRALGPIAFERIIGIARYVYWSPERGLRSIE